MEQHELASGDGDDHILQGTEQHLWFALGWGGEKKKFVDLVLNISDGHPPLLSGVIQFHHAGGGFHYWWCEERGLREPSPLSQPTQFSH